MQQHKDHHLLLLLYHVSAWFYVMTETPTAEELLRKIQGLEEAHRHLKQQKISSSSSSSSIISAAHKRSNRNHNHNHRSETLKTTETQYMNILESMGQSVYIFDVNNRIIYWNQMSENLYGYTVAEALGKTAPDIIIEPTYSELATLIIQRAVQGETWSGQFPVNNKSGEKFTVITTLSPYRDDINGTFGATCVCTDTRHFRPPQSTTTVSHQPPQTASKISSLLAFKIKLKTKTGENNMDHDHSDFTTTDHSNDEGSDNRSRLHKVLSLEAETWMDKTGISWPWKANGNRESSDTRPPRFGGWPWLHYKDQEQYSGPQTSSSASLKLERQLLYGSPSDTTESPCSYSSGTSSSWSIDSIKTDIHIENLDVEILWDDLIIRQQIGQGARATVYHALLYGSDVAVKIFNKQEYPDDAILSFRKEVCLMKRLRYPNILLFMGAVVSPQHLCIVTEFLPRGSLFSLLQCSTTKLDWRRRVHMAIDIARGINYLHNFQPPIIHRNLKSSNLLVDKNWTLKVGDFSLSRIKHETYLATNTRTGMPQWMAPEVLRNEQVDEKADVYSYGVILWEIATGKIPGENLNSMQVIGAVGFMNQQLEIPNDVDPQWASLIECCWSREPQSRPTFKEILLKLKDLQKKFHGSFSGKRVIKNA